MADAFYVPRADGVFVPTPHTAGPWAPDAQHFGPPAALLARAIEECPSELAGPVARISVDILRPAPVEAEYEVDASLLRPGRSVELVGAELTVDDRLIAVARAWRIGATDSAGEVAGQAPPLPGPEQGTPIPRPEGWSPGYMEAMEWRSLHGNFAEQGPATVWARQRVPLVDGEEPSPLQRVLVAADSGNGVSGRSDPSRWWFINTELSVHLQREPVGEWIALDATTIVGPHGVGTAQSALHDTTGQFAVGTQALMIRPRTAGA